LGLEDRDGKRQNKAMLKETFEIVAAFGYVAGAVCAADLARRAWRLFGPSTWKREPFSTPKEKAHRAETVEMMKKLSITAQDFRIR
jgi:hypothetical protein